MAQQTAMKYVLSLVEQMFNNADALKLELPASLLNDIINIITQEGIPMEKEQIMNAWLFGDTDSMYEPKQLDEQAEQYYNETYKK